jgi:hypothetical protein
MYLLLKAKVKVKQKVIKSFHFSKSQRKPIKKLRLKISVKESRIKSKVKVKYIIFPMESYKIRFR